MRCVPCCRPDSWDPPIRTVATLGGAAGELSDLVEGQAGTGGESGGASSPSKGERQAQPPGQEQKKTSKKRRKPVSTLTMKRARKS